MSDTNPEESKSDEKLEFKKPVLIGRIGKLPKKAKNETEVVEEEKPSEKKRENAPESSSKRSLPPAVLLKEMSTPIPYKEPKWSGICPDGSEYSLEVLKSGMIVDKVDLMSKPYYVFGRLANCDVMMAHPTISRHHCILQYKASTDTSEEPSGWYLYDLGSTHGTFLNKDKLRPSHYVRVRVGHQIKFGNSTRTYIMVGPDFDCEGESELSVSEIKQKSEVMKIERERAIQEAIEQRERAREEEERRIEEQGISWGMSEDAEDEPDLFDNPYAATGNEELYLTDPKKTLRGYFEREGLQLEYDCQDRGHSQYMCRVELPLDDARGRPVMAETIHTGKKKDAVVACALEACRILDRAGLLRQAKHEPRRRKIERDPDEYDSDSDSFLDRTGGPEARRARARPHAAPLTYPQLVQKVQDIEAQISSEEATLDRLRSTKSSSQRPTDEQEDPLDEYMSSLSSGGQTMAVKAEISRTKMNIQKLKSELSKSSRLAELARPAALPPLRAAAAPLKISNSVVYGKRIKLKTDSIKKPVPQKQPKLDDEEFVEEMDSDDETETQAGKQNTEGKGQIDVKEESAAEIEDVTVQKKSQDELEKNSKNISKSEGDTVKVSSGSEREKKMYGPMRPPENYVIPEDYYNNSDRDLPVMED